MKGILFLSLFIYFVGQCLGNWNQQYGDYRATNYAEVDSSSNLYNITDPWNYTYPGHYSYMYNSPAVSETGVVFLPFLNYKPPSLNNSLIYDLQVKAMDPNGTVMWVASNLGMDKMCAVIFLTNALYISDRSMVVIGWTCAAAFPYYKKHGQIIGIDSQTGKILWKSDKLYDANDLSRLSATADVVYTSGGYACYKDGLPLKSAATLEDGGFPMTGPPKPPKAPPTKKSDDKNDTGQIYAISLVDGSQVWVKDYTQVGCTSQTRLYPLNDDKHMVIFLTHLPQNVYLAGKLLALECDSKSSCTEKWSSDLHLCWDSTFAFSDKGVLYGGYGFAGNPDLIFGVDIKTGNKLFSNMGYCEPGVYPSGPAVDESGYAYYSCGNRVFSVDSNGTLLWKTDLDNTAGYIFYSAHRFSPAIVPHPDSAHTILVAMNTNSTHIHTLHANNGTLIASTPIPVLIGDNGIDEPPFVVGNRVLWFKAHYYVKFFLFSFPLDMLM